MSIILVPCPDLFTATIRVCNFGLAIVLYLMPLLVEQSIQPEYERSLNFFNGKALRDDSKTNFYTRTWTLDVPSI